MLRVGIVAEGKSEFLVFEEMLRALHPDVDVMRIWPDFQITGRPYGWRGVKAWCQELVARRLLRKKDGEVKKPENKYRPLAEEVAKRMVEVCRHCTQAARFVAEFQAAAAGVAPKVQPGA
jgi:hypothetical protein